MTWPRESQRHGMASRGIRTNHIPTHGERKPKLKKRMDLQYLMKLKRWQDEENRKFLEYQNLKEKQNEVELSDSLVKVNKEREDAITRAYERYTHNKKKLRKESTTHWGKGLDVDTEIQLLEKINGDYIEHTDPYSTFDERFVVKGKDKYKIIIGKVGWELEKVK